MGLTAIVLGAAAGGGFPQWNCNCDVCRLAWAGDLRVRARTQASLAVSADRKRWTLLNASPENYGPPAGSNPPATFVDTLAEYPTFWSFDSGGLKTISNQYAAMPSLHTGWATWSALVLIPLVKRPRLRDRQLPHVAVGTPLRGIPTSLVAVGQDIIRTGLPW